MSVRRCSICGEHIPDLSYKMLDSFGYIVIQQEDLLPFVNAPAEALPFYFCNRHSKSEIQLWLYEAVYCDRKRLKQEKPRLQRRIEEFKKQAEVGITGDYL